MTEIAEFLLARIAEQEAMAQRHVDCHVEIYASWSGSESDESMSAWDDYSPSFVLADCDAKRRVVEQCRSSWDASDCTECNEAGYFADGLLALLALPYADHPDYQQKWKP